MKSYRAQAQRSVAALFQTHTTHKEAAYAASMEVGAGHDFRLYGP